MASYAAADRIGHALPQPTPERLQGLATVTQITALALWGATGSAGAWLLPQIGARKRAVCGV